MTDPSKGLQLRIHGPSTFSAPSVYQGVNFFCHLGQRQLILPQFPVSLSLGVFTYLYNTLGKGWRESFKSILQVFCQTMVG